MGVHASLRSWDVDLPDFSSDSLWSLSGCRKELQSEIARKYLSIPLLDLIVPEAFRSVVVHHSYRLHERVTDSRTDEPETSRAQFSAHRVRLFCGRRNLVECVEPVPDWAAANKPPDVFVEGAEFFTRN